MVNVNINALYTRWAYPKLPKAISFSFLQSVMINVYRLTASSPSTLPSLSDLRGMMLRNCVEEISGQFIALTQISPFELIIELSDQLEKMLMTAIAH